MCGHVLTALAETLYNLTMLAGLPILFFSFFLMYQVTFFKENSRFAPWPVFLSVMVIGLFLHWLMHLAFPGYYSYEYDARLESFQWDYFITVFPFFLILTYVLNLLLRPVVRRYVNSLS
jgi:hypothetical protein